MQKGFDLRAIVSKLYQRDPSRIVLPAVLDNEERFDVELILPGPLDREELYRLVKQGVERYFRFTTVVETREMDVYVMTAEEGKARAVEIDERRFDNGGSMSWSSGEYVEIVSSDGAPVTDEMLRKIESELNRSSSGILNISASNSTVDDFRRTLEEGLDRPIIDETGMKDKYDLEVRGKARSNEDFVEMLRNQTGLILAESRRCLEMLVIRSLA
jgi:uncharacterized protein (TIGR03435 family)